jgi:capsular polysaccharide biosynthesis protein
MSQQAMDLRRSIQIVRRHKRVFGAAVTLGLLAGAAYAVLKPPLQTSSALVVLPQTPAATGQAAPSSTNGDAAGTDIATQAVIAGSDAVLSTALPHIRPAMSLQTLEGIVTVKSVTGSILSITARGATAAEAEATANAVANSFIAYVTGATSPVGHVAARVFEPATTATAPKLAGRIALFGLPGAIGGAIVGFIICLAIGRNDPRLIERDAIANSIGIPVLASFPTQHPSDAAGWTKVFEDYEPRVVYAWRLRTTLQQLGVADPARPNGTVGSVPSVTILSLASDAGALAIGPQLASFAASLGIPTALVIGPQQDANAIATLHTAGTAAPHASERMRHLRVVVSDDGNISVPRGAALVVVVAVVDARTPQMPDTVRTTTTVLGVSAGAATADQLARAATAAAADGREIFGILVADPEPGDQTTGRIPRGRRATPAKPQAPAQVKDVATEIRR